MHIQQDAEFQPLSSDLLYKYSSNNENQKNPVGYVDLGSRRNLSTAPTNIGLGQSTVSGVSYIEPRNV